MDGINLPGIKAGRICPTCLIGWAGLLLLAVFVYRLIREHR